MTFDEIQEFKKLEGQQKNLQSFAINFTYDSQAIEGSTLTLKETTELLLYNKQPKKENYFITEAKAHYKLFFEILEQKENISYSNLMSWHYRQFSKTKPEIAGAPRSVDVGIFGTNIRFPSWKGVPYHLIDFFHWHQRVRNGIHPIYLAALAHLKLVNIHPFEDGNGRTSRLLMNFILHKYNYPMINIKMDDRKSYFEALNMAREYDQWEFVKFISKKMLGIDNNVR